MAEKFLNYKGSAIHYRLFGTSHPVVLLHGFGEDGSVWDQQVEFLKSKFQLIIPDLPGSGKSEMIKDMNMEGFADVIYEILNHENIPICTLIGHSMGGYITLAFAEKYSSYLDAFGLFHSSSYADSEAKKATREKGIEFIKRNGAFEFLKNITPGLFSTLTKENSRSVIEKFINSLDYFTTEALISYYSAMMLRPDRRILLERSSLPVLFVIGEYDTVFSRNDSLQQTHLPNRAVIHILSGSGHMGMLEEPDKSNAILEGFLCSL